MFALFPSKRQWQRVQDVAESEKSLRDEDEEDIIVTDRTRLLASKGSESSSCDENLSEASPNVQLNQARERDLALHVRHIHDLENSEPRFSCIELGNFDQSKHARKAESPFPVRKPSCSHSSWQGFKQLVKKQFMPPFPYGKDMPLEETPHFRQRQIAVINKPLTVLGSSTNLVQLRQLNARIHRSSNKSASKENLSWENHQNLQVSKAVNQSSLPKTSLNAGINAEVTRTKSSKACVMPLTTVKENSILKKLKSRTKKEHVLLLANTRE